MRQYENKEVLTCGTTVPMELDCCEQHQHQAQKPSASAISLSVAAKTRVAAIYVRITNWRLHANNNDIQIEHDSIYYYLARAALVVAEASSTEMASDFI